MPVVIFIFAALRFCWSKSGNGLIERFRGDDRIRRMSGDAD
jgi:hypothetical protein